MQKRRKVLAFILSLVMTSALIHAPARIRAGELPMETMTEGSVSEAGQGAAAEAGASLERSTEPGNRSTEQSAEPGEASTEQSTGISGADADAIQASPETDTDAIQASPETDADAIQASSETDSEPADSEPADSEPAEEESGTENSESGEPQSETEQNAFPEQSFSIYLSAGYSPSSGSSSAVLYLGDTITLSSTSSRYNGTWTSGSPSVASVTGNSDGTASVTGLKAGTAVITYRYGYGGRETYTVTVMDPVITAAVYVAGSDLNGNRFSSEMLDLLNVTTLDGAGYYAAGTLQVDLRELSGNSSSLIRTEEDVAYITNQLQQLNTAASLSDPGNLIGNYISQVQWGSDLGSSQGHMYSGMWVSNGSSNINTATPVNTGGVPTAGETHTWHLDLRFETVHINYIYGHNGITSGATADGNAAGSKVFIRDAQMDYLPAVTPPDGYTIAGYYTDPDFTAPWTGYNQPIHEDQTVYIKLQALPGLTEAGYLTVRKTFEGLTQEQIPSGFVLSAAGTELRTTNANSAEASETGVTYTWKLANVSGTAFSVSEQGENVDGYDCTDSIPENGTVSVMPADIGVHSAAGQQNSRTWTVAVSGDNSTFFAAAIRNQTVIITKDNLSISQRLAVQDWVQSSLGGYPANYAYYNLEGRSSAAFSIESENGGTVNVTYADGQITFPSANVWRAAAAGVYSISQAAQSTDIAVANTYTISMMDLTLTKQVTGNMGDRTKKFTFHITGPDGEQTAFRLADGESETIEHVRIGSTITLAELENTGYEVDVQYGSMENGTFRGSPVIDTDGGYSITIEKDKDQILVTNRRDAVPDTGILFDSAPYIQTLLLLAAAGMTAAVLRRRKKRN